MPTYGEALASAVREGWCSLTQANNNLNAWLSETAPGIAGDFFGSMNGLGEHLYRATCNREPPPRSDRQNVSGGQCAGVRYLIDVSFRHKDEDDPDAPWETYTSVVGASGLTIYGPITNVRFVDGSNGDSVGYRGQCRSAGGALRDNFAFGLSADGKIAQPIQFSPRRYDGQPDTCGDSPTNQRPTINNNRYDTDITYNDNSGNSITLPIGIVYAPVTVNANGELSLPIDVTVNADVTAELNGEFNLSTGGISFNTPGSGGNPNGGCNDVPDGVQGDDPPVTDDDPTDVPEIPAPDDPATFTKIIRGVVITSSEVPSNITEVFQSEGPTLYIPRLGNVYFVSRIGGRNVWLKAIPVNHKSELIPCPWPKGAVDVKFHPVEGVTASVTKVYDSVQVDSGRSAAE